MNLKDFDDYNIELDKFDIKMLNNEVEIGRAHV